MCFFFVFSWKKVGEIVDLNSFPVKSCGPIKLRNAELDDLGMKISDQIHDRVFMITTLERQFVTARTYPKLLQIHPTVNNNVLTLTIPDGTNVSVDVNELQKNQKQNSSVWQQSVETVDAGDEVAKFISNFIMESEDGLRLVFYPKNESTRHAEKIFNDYENIKQSDSSALADATSYMLINQSSIDDLSGRVGFPIKPLQFRPNFVVKGPEPLAEDNWKWIRIGDEVLFRTIKPCTR